MKHSLAIDSIILEFDTKRVLQDVYLENETGKTTGILGRNGSGKTCLMNIIYGELKTNNKSIRLNGKVACDGLSEPETIKYLPQFSFIPKGLKVRTIFKDFGLSFSAFVAYFPDFEKYFNSRLKSLSEGERRIVEIYCIAASKTKFCMLDEPFSQVMPVHINTIKDIINKEKENKGIIITDHLYEHIIDICDEVYVIANGKTNLIKECADLVKFGYLSETKGFFAR